MMSCRHFSRMKLVTFIGSSVTRMAIGYWTQIVHLIDCGIDNMYHIGTL